MSKVKVKKVSIVAASPGMKNIVHDFSLHLHFFRNSEGISLKEPKGNQVQCPLYAPLG